MDHTADNARSSPNQYSANYRQNYGSSHSSKFAGRNSSYSEQVGDEYVDEEEGEEVEEEEEEDEENGGHRVEEEADEEQEEEEEAQQEEENNGDNDDNSDDDDNDGGNYSRRNEGQEDSGRHRKKRKLKSLEYEFAPRVVASSVTTMAAPKSSFGGRNFLADWTEHSTFVLLDAWGDRFVQLGRRSLRSDEWIEVAKKVSQASKTIRTDTQCRNRLDTLKKKYKKEKMKLAEMGSNTSKWVYFKKMDMLMNSSPRQSGLSCGLDSGEYVFMNPTVYLNHSNGFDEMRDSPGNSLSSNEDEDDDNSDGLPPSKTRSRENGGERSSFRLLADSIKKFGEIYEKIENSKREQMLELEKMKMDFHRDLEMQKKKILERAQAEIAKIQRENDEEVEVPGENMSE